MAVVFTPTSGTVMTAAAVAYCVSAAAAPAAVRPAGQEVAKGGTEIVPQLTGGVQVALGLLVARGAALKLKLGEGVADMLAVVVLLGVGVPVSVAVVVTVGVALPLTLADGVALVLELALGVGVLEEEGLLDKLAVELALGLGVALGATVGGGSTGSRLV